MAVAGSLVSVIVFWWGVLFLVPGAERVFLVREATRLEPSTAASLAVTLLNGARADLIVASLGVVITLLAAAVVTLPVALMTARRRGRGVARPFRVGVMVAGGVLAALWLLVVTVDMAYYGYNRSHLDVVFFDYVDELLARAPASAPGVSDQAIEQTRAELGELGKWAARLAAFAAVQLAVIVGWRWLFRRRVEPALVRSVTRAPRASPAVLCLCLAAGATGLHHQGPLAIALAGISNTTYYALAQNSIWQTADAWLLAFGPNQQGTRARAEGLMPLDEAIRLTRQTLAPAGAFASDTYPLVRRAAAPAGSSEPGRPTSCSSSSRPSTGDSSSHVSLPSSNGGDTTPSSSTTSSRTDS
jgi:hypothetical protein